MPGLFIVIEGADGAGKSTQLKLLKARLDAVGYDVELFDFPRYSEPSSVFVRHYLAGEYGPASEVSPYTASLFYAMDRFEATPGIRKALSENKVVLADRFTGSNMAHQGSKFGSQAEKRGFFIWAENLEFELLNISRPDINFYLNMPLEIAAKLISKRAKETNTKLDEHEKDSGHLDATGRTYKLLCELFPKDFQMITCAKDGIALPVTKISDEIWTKIKPILPPNPPREPQIVKFKIKTKIKYKPKPRKNSKK